MLFVMSVSSVSSLDMSLFCVCVVSLVFNSNNNNNNKHVAVSYGVRFVVFVHVGRVRLCCVYVVLFVL